MRFWVIPAVLALATTSRAADGDGQRWWSHVAYLADDALQGRDTGSPGHRQAADYVADQFKKMGLRPAGTEGYLQPVQLRTRRIDEARCRLALVQDGATQPLTLGEQAVISLRVDPAPTVEAPLVFAGYGLSVPEAGHDDFAGLDVRGKLVVYLQGAPPSLPGPLAAHAQSAGERSAALRKAGAIGSVAIANPKHMDIPWERSALARFLPAMALADPALDDNRGLQAGFTFNPAHAQMLFADTGHTFRELLESADAGRPLPRFPIPMILQATIGVDRSEVLSHNVAAVLPGTDPKLKDEFIVFSHLDHIGVGKPINGDSIYNGAMDNASGVASLLDVAAMLRDARTALRRSVVFLAVTGEEKGLLGSKFFAHHPTVSPVVADLNSDMFLPLYPLRRLTVYGIDESDLGAEAAAVAGSLGIGIEPDPEPLRNVFIRSDQYSFIRRGVPSVMFKIGYAPGSPEEATFKTWLKDRYHAPADDLAQPVDKGAAEAFDRYLVKLLERVANRDARPHWNDASFFRRFAP